MPNDIDISKIVAETRKHALEEPVIVGESVTFVKRERLAPIMSEAHSAVRNVKRYVLRTTVEKTFKDGCLDWDEAHEKVL